MTRSHTSALALLAAIAVAGCLETTRSGTVTVTPTVPSGGDTTGTTTTATKLSLDNCTTSISADAPAFYQKYFRCVTITVESSNVVIHTNDLPPHDSPYYASTSPNYVDFDTMGGTRWKNPNTLAEQNITVRIPMNPVAKAITITDALVDGMAGTSTLEYHGSPQGINLDGVAMFHGVAAPGDDISVEEHTFDHYEGHPQNTGVYHYHSASPGPMEVLKAKGVVSTTVPGAGEIELYAVMCDGTLVLGCVELDGSEPNAADMDGQNGHVHDITDSDGLQLSQRYHTHLCPAKFTHTNYSPEIQYYTTCGN